MILKIVVSTIVIVLIYIVLKMKRKKLEEENRKIQIVQPKKVKQIYPQCSICHKMTRKMAITKLDEAPICFACIDLFTKRFPKKQRTSSRAVLYTQFKNEYRNDIKTFGFYDIEKYITKKAVKSERNTMTPEQLESHLAYLNRDFHEGFPFQGKDIVELESFKENTSELLPSLKTNIALVEEEELQAIVVNPEFYFELLRAWNYVDDLEVSKILKKRSIDEVC